VLVFADGDEVVGRTQALRAREQPRRSQFTAIGAFREVLLGWFNPEARKYEEIPVPEQVEVLTLTGDICAAEKGPSVHAHAVLGRRDGSAAGGHLLVGRVRPTLEMVLTGAAGESPEAA